jgi:transcriptional regulator of heat shock response
MPKKKSLVPVEELTNRQKTILFALIKEYCETGKSLGSNELKEKYGFEFSSATIRNEFVVLRNTGYLYQPFVNSGSVPTEKAFKLFINQMLVGLQVTAKQQQELKKQLQEMQLKQAALEKEISRLLALQTGVASFSVSPYNEGVAGIKNLFLESEPKPSQISRNPIIRAIIGSENPVIPLGKGYAMVTAEVLFEGQEKSVIGLVTPIRFLGKKKNLQILDGLAKALQDLNLEDKE